MISLYYSRYVLPLNEFMIQELAARKQVNNALGRFTHVAMPL